MKLVTSKSEHGWSLGIRTNKHLIGVYYLSRSYRLRTLRPDQCGLKFILF